MYNISNISKIVNSCQRCPSPFATQGIEYLEVPLREDMDEDDISDIVDAMNKAVAFIGALATQIS